MNSLFLTPFTKLLELNLALYLLLVFSSVVDVVRLGGLELDKVNLRHVQALYQTSARGQPRPQLSPYEP